MATVTTTALSVMTTTAAITRASHLQVCQGEHGRLGVESTSGSLAMRRSFASSSLQIGR